MRLTENLMKQILYLIIIIITLSSCKKTNYTIEGRVLTEVEGEMIYLKVSGEDSNIAIDSTVITNGRFHFGGYIDNPQMGYLYCSNIPNGYPIVIEPGKIEISILNDVRISGTNSNNILNNYLVKFHHTTSKKMELQKCCNMSPHFLHPLREFFRMRIQSQCTSREQIREKGEQTSSKKVVITHDESGTAPQKDRHLQACLQGVETQTCKQNAMWCS